MAELHRLCAAAEVPPGSGKEFRAGDKVIAVFNVAGSFHAVQGICPHRGGPLAEGILAGTSVTCPWHAWSFDVATGSRCGFPEGMGKIACYTVRVQDADLYVEL
jgi:nitrite reductase (NADH) small subunit